jgi:hypothetical protein
MIGYKKFRSKGLSVRILRLPDIMVQGNLHLKLINLKLVLTEVLRRILDQILILVFNH